MLHRGASLNYKNDAVIVHSARARARKGGAEGKLWRLTGDINSEHFYYDAARCASPLPLRGGEKRPKIGREMAMHTHKRGRTTRRRGYVAAFRYLSGHGGRRIAIQSLDWLELWGRNARGIVQF
jgi:hypothetical protein